MQSVARFARPMFWGVTLSVLLSVFFWPQPAESVVVDPGSRATATIAESEILERLTTALDASGVDVRFGFAQAATDTALRDRPQLAPLLSLPPLAADDSVRAQGFASLFLRSVYLADAGIETVLVAVESAPRTSSVSIDDFEALWTEAPPHKRVFVSFAGADREHAHKVSAALRRAGYVPFLYIHEGEAKPWSTSIDVGAFFQQAGVRLVLDSENARKSPGTMIEYEAAAGLRDGSLQALISGDPQSAFENRSFVLVNETTSGSSAQATSTGCCRWCRRSAVSKNSSGNFYCRSNVVSGSGQCSAVQCGSFCRNAR